MKLQNSKNSAKIARNRGRNDLPHITILRHFFVVPLRQRALPISANSSQSAKNRPLLYSFSLRLHIVSNYAPSSLSRTADVKRNAPASHWRRSFTRIKSCIRVDTTTNHLTHNACFNTVPFKHLLSSTGYLHHSALNHISPIPISKGAPRDQQHYVMLVKCWVILSPHNCHSYAARLESLRLCQTGNTHQILVHNSRWRLPVLSLLSRAPVAWKCRNGRQTEENPFRLVWTSCKTSMVSMARSHKNTVQIILLPSHTTHTC